MMVMQQWVVKSAAEICRSMNDPIRRVYERMRDVAYSCIPYLNSQEAAFLANAAVLAARKARSWQKMGREVDLSRPCFLEILTKAANAMDRRLQTKAKAVRLEACRAQGSAFYLCSWHQTPAAGHKDLQGKLYVDRFWRSRVPESLAHTVQKLIDDRSMMTIQEVTGDPYWLIYRPYCRHYFVPIDTYEVLGAASEKELRSRHPEAHMPVHRSLTKDQLRQRRARLRARVKKVGMIKSPLR